MKNLVSISFVLVVLIFTSCTKDNTVIPALDVAEIQDVDRTIIDKSEDALSIAPTSEIPAEAIPITLRLQVTEVASFETSTTYTVDFTGNYDFTGVVVEDLQSLKFTDANGSPVSLNFSVNSYSGSNGTLNIVFAMGGNSIGGLGLDLAQEIIVEDHLMN